VPRKLTWDFFRSLLVEDPRKAVHEASAGCRSEQDRAPHLLSCRELCEPLRDTLGRDHHRDGSPMGVAVVFVWHSPGVPEDG
jgi:hypothetical protein